MRERDIRENLKRIGLITSAIFIFMIIIPFILMGASIDDFTSPKGTGEANSNEIIVKGNNKVKVYRTNTKKIEEMDVEEYILGVVSSEMPAKFELEALKAQAVAARTFYYSKREKKCNLSKGAEICDGVHCQAYMSKNERMSKWANDEKNDNYNKIKRAVQETSGMVLSYGGELVKYPQFFSTSSGKTENSEDVFSNTVPYLKSTSSPGEEISNVYQTEKEISNKEFVNVINSNYKKAALKESDIKSKISIKSRTEGGSVNDIQIGGVTIKGTEFRKLFDLRSANFNIEYLKDKVKIVCKGNGHGVGMSQWGANVMAKNGKKYDEILKHYYSGVDVKKVVYR
ncbi:MULTISPECIES: stage II sporulation protein D [Clostridium]|uniref:Stage II sporulation protein D n=1 Tax=Clostridium nitritogenes TaxID=83340 RepID=A0ABP3X6S5_9CLOT|nr:stage II sporulation protein D [Clostridium baratii]AQM59230.1 stage II sporulation protein D [Clostridium baratii]STB00646.1 stage II sporulation protein D [Clostridium baratii]